VKIEVVSAKNFFLFVKQFFAIFTPIIIPLTFSVCASVGKQYLLSLSSSESFLFLFRSINVSAHSTIECHHHRLMLSDITVDEEAEGKSNNQFDIELNVKRYTKPENISPQCLFLKLISHATKSSQSNVAC
jgi:hypothetical protein